MYFQGYSLPECIVFAPFSFAPIFVYSIQIYLFLHFMDDLQKKKINMRSYNVQKEKITWHLHQRVQPQSPCRLWLTGVATIYYSCFQLSLNLPNWEVNSGALQSGLYLLWHFALSIRSDRSALAFKDL